MNNKTIEIHNNYTYIPDDMRGYYNHLYKSMCTIRDRLANIYSVSMDQVRYGKEKVSGTARLKTKLLGLPFECCTYHKVVDISIHTRTLRDCDRAYRMIIHFNEFAYSIRNDEDLDHAVTSIANSIMP